MERADDAAAVVAALHGVEPRRPPLQACSIVREANRDGGEHRATRRSVGRADPAVSRFLGTDAPTANHPDHPDGCQLGR